MFNRVAYFALCLAPVSLSACAGAGGQADGTAQRQDALLAELSIIGAIIDAGENSDSDSVDGDDDGRGDGGATVLAVGTLAIAAGIANLVYGDGGDVDAPKAAPLPSKSSSNVGAAPGFIKAAQRSEI